jgi:hypothetical protein
MYTLQFGIPFGVPGLAECAELRLKLPIPSAIGFYSWIVPGRSATTEGATYSVLQVQFIIPGSF